jgi:hypothetical protein
LYDPVTNQSGSSRKRIEEVKKKEEKDGRGMNKGK